MTIKKSILLPLMFLFILPFVFSATSYQYTSGNEQVWNVDGGRWDADKQASGDWSLTTSKTIQDYQETAMQDDLDGDGADEVVVVDGRDFIVYDGDSLLTVQSSYSASNISGRTSTIIYDIDNDGNKEVISASSNQNFIYIMEYDGSNLTLENSLFMNVNHDLTNGGTVSINCRATDDCLAVVQESHAKDGTATLSAVAFDSNHARNVTVLQTTNQLVCLPVVNHLTVKNVDNIGNVEYVMTHAWKTTTTNPDVSVSILDPSADLNKTNIIKQVKLDTLWSEASTLGGSWDSNSDCTTNNLNKRFSTPLVLDVSQNWAGHEIVVAQTVATGLFKNFILRADATKGSVNPEFVSGAIGSIVSNPFMADIWTATGDFSFCTVGWLDTNNEINLLCGTRRETGGFGNDDEIWEYDFGDFDNNASTDWNYSNIAFSSEQDNTRVEDGNPDEIIINNGVFRINDYDGTSNQQLTRIFDDPAVPSGTDTTIIMLDAQESGQSDMLLFTGGALHYYDDNFDNTGGRIFKYKLDPCWREVWEINTTVEATVWVNDTDGDQVSARVVLYANTTNIIDSGWSANLSTPASFSFDLGTANQTINDGIVTFYGRDTGDPADIDSFNETFSVSTAGIKRGDGISCERSPQQVDPTTPPIPDPNTDPDNMITTGLASVTALTGLSSLIIWIFLMILVGWGFLLIPEMSGMVKMVGLAMAEILMIMLGYFLGFIGFGVILTFVIISLAIIGFLLRGFIVGETRS